MDWNLEWSAFLGRLDFRLGWMLVDGRMRHEHEGQSLEINYQTIIHIYNARNNELMHTGPGPRGLHTGARLARPKAHSISRRRLDDPTHGW
jgi:hypothetical protein